MKLRVSRSFLLLVVGSVLAQTSKDLTATYGHPQMERYSVPPGVSLSVSYGPDGEVCLLELGSKANSGLEENTAKEVSYVASAVVDQLLRELLPPEARKGEPVESLMISGCLTLRTQEYQNVRIRRIGSGCRPPTDDIQSVSVEWKRTACH